MEMIATTNGTTSGSPTNVPSRGAPPSRGFLVMRSCVRALMNKRTNKEIVNVVKKLMITITFEFQSPRVNNPCICVSEKRANETF
ncbi:unnamed protein product [Acanthocheilonema viteae]|uniref:Uncharacterized protein n=1 Tax=Acanthocheilonema viteae TaxID=6277 RepID=A0A498SLD6_ACAVI|nr:unnamed protein product [Acanthocheilonema viteae]